jgi:hypothetical protein
MKRPLSAYSKAIVSAGVVLAGTIAATFPDSAIGKWCVVAGAVAAARGLTAATKNTQTVDTGNEPGPVTLAKVVSSTGQELGSVVADTGTAAGGIVAGTTGVVGSVLDATLGKLIPGGEHR